MNTAIFLHDVQCHCKSEVSQDKHPKIGCMLFITVVCVFLKRTFFHNFHSVHQESGRYFVNFYLESNLPPLKQVQNHEKLNLLYLVDSIVKNVGGSYINLFERKIVKMFEETFTDKNTVSCFLFCSVITVA